MLSDVGRGVVAVARRGFAALAVGAGSLLLFAAPAVAQGAPDPPPAAPPGVEAVANDLIGWLKWGALAAGVVGMIICGVMMMVGRRNRSTTAVDGATGIPWVLGGLSTVAVAAGVVGQVLS